jgi:hypothetical protein
MDMPIGNEGALAGTSPVTVLAAPAEWKQRVVPASGLSVCNCDTVAHDLIFQKRKGASVYIFWKELAIPAGTHVVLPKKVVLDATDESLEVVSNATATTTEPRWDLAAMECS